MRPRFDSVPSCHLQPKDGACTLRVAENMCVCARVRVRVRVRACVEYYRYILSSPAVAESGHQLS
jgi:hypothetical protein